jgi:hypothetical protein
LRREVIKKHDERKQKQWRSYCKEIAGTS